MLAAAKGRKRGRERGTYWAKSEKERLHEQLHERLHERQLNRCPALLLLAVFVLLRGGGVEAQFTDGGEVALDCSRCECTGTSDDGDVAVFDNPSTGKRVVSVGGGYSEIADTTCGTSVFAVGSTIYQLSGVDLGDRQLEVWDMSGSDCTISGIPSSANCYSGSMEMDLGGGISMTLTNCLCIYDQGLSTFYRSKVSATVMGARSISIPNDEIEVCLEPGFISQLVTAIVGDETYRYNFDLVIPGEPSSADLDVSSAPGSSAQDFSCGELQDPTPAPVEPVPTTPEPTPGPTTEPPVAPPPNPPPTPSPVEPVAQTPGPVAATPRPVSPATEAPVAPATPRPTAALLPTPLTTPAPVGGNLTSTLAPAAAGNETLAPTPVFSGAVTPAPSAGSSSAATLAPLSRQDVEGQECILPLPENDSCTYNTEVASTLSGIGSFYDPACKGTAGQGIPPGCESSSPRSCRSCLFNTPRWRAQNPGKEPPGFVDCPCCVLDVYNEETAANDDGPRCEVVTPAPTVTTPSPSSVNPITLTGNLVFEDKTLTIGSAGLVAFAGLVVLTFFPVFVN